MRMYQISLLCARVFGKVVVWGAVDSVEAFCLDPAAAYPSPLPPPLVSSIVELRVMVRFQIFVQSDRQGGPNRRGSCLFNC